MYITNCMSDNVLFILKGKFSMGKRTEDPAKAHYRWDDLKRRHLPLLLLSLNFLLHLSPLVFLLLKEFERKKRTWKVVTYSWYKTVKQRKSQMKFQSIHSFHSPSLMTCLLPTQVLTWKFSSEKPPSEIIAMTSHIIREVSHGLVGWSCDSHKRDTRIITKTQGVS